MKNNIKFAIVGCGVISNIHAKCISEIPSAKLTAVFDNVPEKAREIAKKFGAEAYTDYDEFLRCKDIDVVDILTPSGTHSQLGISAARAGKHVIVEKPMDITLEGADQLIKVCREENKKLCCIMQHRFDKGIKELKRAVEEGRLGRLNFGSSYTKWYRTQEYYDSASWRGTWKYDGGGALMNQSIHYIDLLIYIMGDVQEVFAYCSTGVHERIEVEDTSGVALKFKSGAIGIIEGHTGAYPGFETRLDIYGEKGSVIIRNDRIQEWKFKSGESIEIDSTESGLDESLDPSAVHIDSHKEQIEDMVNAVLLDREPFVNGEKGREALALILAIYESAKTGKPVLL